MNELIKLVSEKTGLSEDMAKVAVNTVLDFLKKKLPNPIAAQIDSALSGDVDLGDVAKGLGGLLGKK
ncbi:MAG: hypothetical protein Kow00124_15450 [Anaerolineae bacterium]